MFKRSIAGAFRSGISSRGRAVAAFCVGAAVLWGLGGNAFSVDSTSRMLGPVVDWLPLGSSPWTPRLSQFVFRKSLHFFLYGGLALLALRMLLLGSVPLIRASLVAVGMTMVLAALDEGRQAWSGGRTGQWADVVIDTAGATMAVGAANVWMFCVNRPRVAKQDAQDAL